MAIEARDFNPSKENVPSLKQSLDDTFDTIYEPGPGRLTAPISKEQIIQDRVIFEELGKFKKPD